jgi:hypothetical protein
MIRDIGGRTALSQNYRVSGWTKRRYPVRVYQINFSFVLRDNVWVRVRMIHPITIP